MSCEWYYYESKTVDTYEFRKNFEKIFKQLEISIWKIYKWKPFEKIANMPMFICPSNFNPREVSKILKYHHRTYRYLLPLTGDIKIDVSFIRKRLHKFGRMRSVQGRNIYCPQYHQIRTKVCQITPKDRLKLLEQCTLDRCSQNSVIWIQ